MAITMTQQGSFTSDGNNKTIKLTSGIDWMRIVNYTASAGATNGDACNFDWRYGMGTNSLSGYHPAADQTLAVRAVASSFAYIDSSTYTGGALTAVTDGTNATRPVYDTGSTAGLSDGCVVRISSTDHENINGLDFSIDTIVANTSFRLANTLATAPGLVSGAGYYKLVAPDIATYKMITPSSRVIANITQAASGVITTIVDHAFLVGQKVRIQATTPFGMTEINDVITTVTAVSASTLTVATDTTGFTAFKFALPSDVAFTPAMVHLVGRDPLYTVDASLTNQFYKGMILTAGVTQPAGDTSDVIYWEAGTSYSIDNE